MPSSCQLRCPKALLWWMQPPPMMPGCPRDIACTGLDDRNLFPRRLILATLSLQCTPSCCPRLSAMPHPGHPVPSSLWHHLCTFRTLSEPFNDLLCRPMALPWPLLQPGSGCRSPLPPRRYEVLPLPGWGWGSPAGRLPTHAALSAPCRRTAQSPGCNTQRASISATAGALYPLCVHARVRAHGYAGMAKKFRRASQS